MNRSKSTVRHALMGIVYASIVSTATAQESRSPTLRDSTSPELRDVASRNWATAFSPDGKSLAVTGGWTNPREPGELVLWDVESETPTFILRQDETIRAAAFSPDGTRLAIVDFAGGIRLLDPKTGAVTLSLPKQKDMVNSVTFTPKGDKLLTGGFDETLKTWNPSTGELLHTVKLPGEGVTMVAVSPNGNRIAATTWPGKVHVWDRRMNERFVANITNSGEIAETVTFSPDGKSLVTGGWDGALTIWNVRGFGILRNLAPHQSPVMNTIYSPDGQLLISSASDGRLRVFDPNTGALSDVLDAHRGLFAGLSFSPDGKRLATTAWDRKVLIWDVRTWERIASLERKVPSIDDPSEIEALAKQLAAQRELSDVDEYATRIRQLARIGSPAVPSLIKALDQAEATTPLRLLPFTLRAIGDPRAVPALIESIPRTLIPLSSDVALPARDRDLLRFMQEHDNDEGPSAAHFSIHRPVRELFSTLQTITKVHHGEKELYSVVILGGPRQQAMQQHLYLEVAHRWATWWRENWSDYVDDPEYAKVTLDPLPERNQSVGFPEGPNAQAGPRTVGRVIGSIWESPEECFLDLDTNRNPAWPESIPWNQGQPSDSQALHAWAAREGVHLIGTEYTPPGSETPYYSLKARGVQVWQIDNHRWETLKQELQNPDPLELGIPCGDLLLPYDPETGQFTPDKPATFLFLTSNGVSGALRTTGQIRRLRTASNLPFSRHSSDAQTFEDQVGFRKGIRIDYRWFYNTDEAID